MKKAFQADKVFIGNQEVINNGVVELNQDGTISHIGENYSSGDIPTQILNGFLCPGFINTHCHLELSHLKNKVSERTQLHGFVKELQQVRVADENAIQSAIIDANIEMQNNGIVAVGDISNGESSFDTKINSNIHYHSFIELFGFNKSMAQEIYNRGLELKQTAQAKKMNASIVPHSPYSVSNDLMDLIGNTSTNSPISIHNQETEGENLMFRDREGSIIDMLNQFGLDLSEFKANKKSSIFNYLPYLNKRTNTLLVHNTFTTKEDITWAESIHPNLFWCFCPNANKYIENRLPNINQFIEAKVKCTIGTDSLASNWQLSIWAEIKTILKEYSNIKIETLIEMACYNGAQFLGIEKKMGTLEVGQKPGLNWIKNENVTVLS
jgi:cytosine/adenosine deaminase-related metal-dependent hydrolase